MIKEPPYLSMYPKFFERVERSVDPLKSIEHVIDTAEEYEGRARRAGRRVWIIGSSVLLKIPSLELTIGPFSTNTHVLARYGWGVQIEQNYVSLTVRAKLVSEPLVNERINYSIKWRGSKMYSNVKDAWEDFRLISTNPCAKDAVRKNLSETGRVLWMDRTGSLDVLDTIIRQRGESVVLKRVGDMARESLGHWRPSRLDEKAIEKEPMVEDYTRNWHGDAA